MRKDSMERRDSSGAVAVVRAENAAPKIGGYAAVYYRDGEEATEYRLWDDETGVGIERIMAGAFDGALSRGDDVRALFNHDANMVLGRVAAGTLRLSADDHGLAYEIDAAETRVAGDVLSHVERGDVTGSSFSFTIPPGGERWRDEIGADGRTVSIREVLTAIIYDVGPVTFPAYSATVAAKRYREQVADLRAESRARRNRRDAVRVAADLDCITAEDGAQ